jgi:hypothetical protein
MADGFLGRWSQRKVDVRQGKALVEPVIEPSTAPQINAAVEAQSSTVPEVKGADDHGVTACSADATPVPARGPDAPPLTLQDAQALGLESDYRPFVARGVDSAVSNAAMKKLFTDPHFNVMDRLDTYIDDYSQPDPLPLSMLRKMASAQFLNLLDDDPDKDASPPITSQDHADTDLRLQQDNAPGSPQAGHGAE